MLHNPSSIYQSGKAPDKPGAFALKTLPPKRAMHKADGDLMESTTDTNRKQADKRNSQLTDDNEGGGGENAC